MTARRKFGWVVMAAALSLAVSCGESDDGSGGAAGGGGGGASIGPIEWSDCTLEGLRHACATIDVPLDWSDPDSRRIEISVRRVDRGTVASRGQLWMLQGGPGYDGSALVPLAPHFAELGFDVYIPDYRGTGRSTPLACMGWGTLVTDACKREIVDRFEDGLAFFSTTAAAIDLGRTIEALRQPGEKVFVYGSSYGTFMLNRYLTLFPSQADGAVFDSIVPASGVNLHGDRVVDTIARRVFDACGRDEACSRRLSADPWAKLAALQAKLDAGHCPAFTRPYARLALSLIVGTLLKDPRFIPAVLASAYRLDRCDPADAAAVRTLLVYMYPEINFVPVKEAPYSSFLYQHVMFSEFWRDLDPEELLAEADELVIAPNYNRTMVQLHAAWDVPIYRTPDELYAWADVSMPLLLLNGDLDQQTPLFDLEGIRDVFNAPRQTFVEVPNGGHGLLLEGTAPGGLGTCGFRMISDFLLDPEGTVDTSCLASFKMDFEGEILGPTVFGTPDLWENGPPNVAPIVAPPDPELAAALQRAVQRAARPGW